MRENTSRIRLVEEVMNLMLLLPEYQHLGELGESSLLFSSAVSIFLRIYNTTMYLYMYE